MSLHFGAMMGWTQIRKRDMQPTKPKILHLTLYHKWFNEIALGAKKVEYRQIKPYWNSRLKGREYDEIWFRNGYSPESPFMRVQCNGIVTNTTSGYYDILLGHVLEVKNMKQQKLDLKQHLELIPSDPPRIKRPRKGKKAVFPDEKIKGNTGGLQLTLWPYKGQQTNI